LKDPFRFAANVSCFIFLIGFIGILSFSFFDEISPAQFSQCFVWYAGFKDSAPRWPFLIHSTDTLLEKERLDECAEIHCPSAKLTVILKKTLGHIDPITAEPHPPAMFDSRGHISDQYAEQMRNAKGEMCLTLYGNSSRAQTCQWIQGDGAFVNDKGAIPLFFLIWIGVIGMPGTILRVAIWIKGRKEDDARLNLGRF